MKFMSKIGEIVDIGKYLFCSPTHFLQLGSSMRSNFRLRRPHFEGRIPGSSSPTVEASSKRIWVSKRRVNYMRQPKAGNQFNCADARQSATLAKQPIICSTLKLRQVAEQIIVVSCEKIEDWPATITIAIGNKTMSPVLFHLDPLRRFHFPPRRASRSCRTLRKAGMPPFFTYWRGESPPNIGFVFGSAIQASARFWP